MMRLYLLVQFVSGARVSHEDELTVGAETEVEQHQFGVARHNSAFGSAIGNPSLVAAGQYCSNHLEIGSEHGRNDGFGYSLATCASAVRSESRCQSGFFYFSASYNGQCKCALDDCSERDSSAAHNIYQLSTWRCTPSGQFPNAVQLRNTLSGRLVNDNDGRIGADVGAVISPLREFTVNLDDSRTTGGWAEDGQQWCIEDAGRPDQYTITNLLSGNRLYHTDGLVSARNPADDSCTFTSRGTGFANGGRFGNGNRRCGTCCGASDTTSPMCDGSTSDGQLHISEEEMQARCGADAACVGYSTHIASEAFRPVSSIESVASSDTAWETHEKICGRNTEESWFVAEGQYCSNHLAIGSEHGFGYSLATCASAVRSESRCQSGFFYFSASYNGQCKCALDDCSERDSSAAHNIYHLLCTFETYPRWTPSDRNSGAPLSSVGNNRCGTEHGASDTTSPMCDGSTSDGQLHISEEEVQARCSADAACVGYSHHLRNSHWGPVPGVFGGGLVWEGGYFRPLTRSLDGRGLWGTGFALTHWTTHEKICPH